MGTREGETEFKTSENKTPSENPSSGHQKLNVRRRGGGRVVAVEKKGVHRCRRGPDAPAEEELQAERDMRKS